MAFYDYKCAKCGNIFEIQKGMNERSDPECPRCGSVSRRVFSVFRTIRSEQNGSCSSCSSGVCSTCGGR